MAPLNDVIFSLNNYFKIDQFSLSVLYVFWFLVAISIAITLLFVFTVFILVMHKIGNHYEKKHHKIFHSLLVNFALDPSAPMPKAGRWTRKYLRNSILDILLVTKGFERTVLLDVYKENNFWNEDLKKLSAFRWYKRLGALVRLDQWHICLEKDHLNNSLQDGNEQIRQIAIKNLSRTENPAEAIYLLDILSAKHFFHSTIHESIHKLIQHHPEVVMRALDDKKKEVLWPFILKAIGNLRMIEATPKLIDIANQIEHSPSKEKALVALGKIGDPRSIETLKHALLSLSAPERIAALQSLYNIDPTQILIYKKMLVNDPDPVIKNWISFYMKTVE